MKKLVLVPLLLLISIIVFGQDSTVVQKDSLTQEQIFTKVDIEASFPGGASAWAKFLQTTLDFMVAYDNGAPTGKYRVVLKFLVAIDGTVSDISVEKDPGFGTAQECIRLIKRSGKWIPAKLNGRDVDSWKFQPITFVVSDQ